MAKIPRSRRWRVTAFGQRIMSTSVKLRQWQFPDEYARAARTPRDFFEKIGEPTKEDSYPVTGCPEGVGTRVAALGRRRARHTIGAGGLVWESL
jgi:hypothetical protein